MSPVDALQRALAAEHAATYVYGAIGAATSVSATPDLFAAVSAAYAEHRQFPIIPCNLCGSQEGLQRQQMREMINDWDRRFPGRVDNLFTALSSVVPSHLMDRGLYPFETIKATGRPEAGGDIAFDEDEGCGSPGAGAASATSASAAAIPGQAAISLTQLRFPGGHAPGKRGRPAREVVLRQRQAARRARAIQDDVGPAPARQLRAEAARKRAELERRPRPPTTVDMTYCVLCSTRERTDAMQSE